MTKREETYEELPPKMAAVEGLRDFVEWYRVFGFERGLGID